MFPYYVSRSYCYILSASITLLTIKYIAQFGVSYEPVSQNRRDLKDDAKLSDFYKTWCEVRRYRKDWEKIREPCQGLIKWGATKEGWNESTDAAKSVIISKDIRPVYEFSRVFIETRTAKGERKKVGGDSWRVRLRGPSSPTTTIFDHQDGTYEVVFLLFEPGVYSLHAYLEHSLCEGLRDPPDNWYIIGNAQGKHQPEGSLGNDHVYICAELSLSKEDSTIHVENQPSTEYLEAVNMLMQTKTSICNDNCKLIWDGFGRWVNGSWIPYKTTTDYQASPPNQSVKATYNGMLWFYGDSVMEQFYSNVKIFGRLCKFFTKACSHTYNWTYKIRGFNTTIAKYENDDKDFNITKLIGEVSSVAYHPVFNRPDSVLFINLGLHYTAGVKFADYKILISGLIDMFKHGYTGKVVWRTTTSLYKHKLWGKHEQARRFLNHHRVLLYNALATNQMCAAGFPVLDVFPMTDCHPNGTGVNGKKSDAVHYEHSTFRTVERLLEDVFRRREI